MSGDLCIGMKLAIPSDARDELISNVASLATSANWAPGLRYRAFTVEGGRHTDRRPGSVKAASLLNEARDLVADENLSHVRLASAARSTPPYSLLAIRSTIGVANYKNLSIKALTSWGDGAVRSARWLCDVLEIARVSRAQAGAATIATFHHAFSDVLLVGLTLNGAQVHPAPEQVTRMQVEEGLLGIRYACFPRWGTLLSRAHIDAVGGLGTIVDTVKPAVVTEFDSAVYFQVTPIAEWDTPESLAKQQALLGIVEPLLPPPRRLSPEGAETAAT